MRTEQTVAAYLPPRQNRAWSVPELEAAIEANPDDRAGLLVWADALTEHGDARGELIVAEHAGTFAEAWQCLRPTLIGALEPEVSEGSLELLWEHGLLFGGRITTADPAQTTGRLLELPLARFLRALAYEGLSLETADQVIDALAGSVRGTQVRSLTMARSHVDWTRLFRLETAAPMLERLELEGDSRWLKKPEPFLVAELRSLVLKFNHLSATGLRNIRAMQLPKLERFELAIGTYDGEWDRPVELDDLRPLAGGQGLERVTHFGLTGSVPTAELLELLSASTMTPRLRVLDLSRGGLRGADVDGLLERADCFRHLEWLDLSGNLLDEAAVARVAARLPNVRLQYQRDS